MVLNKSVINNYQNYGVTVLRNIIPIDWIKKLQIGVIKNFQNPSKYKCVYEKDIEKELFYDDYCNWQRIDEYKQFFFKSGVAKIVSQLMNSKIVNIFHEHVLIKEADSKNRTPWHQDQSYYCVNGKDNCSLWIPLDSVEKSICPEFIQGSHKWNKQFLPTKFFGENYEHRDQEFKKIPDIEKNKKEYDIISWDLKLGDTIAFNFATIHGAPENKSSNIRRAFSARFTGDDATFAKRKGEISPPFPEVKLNHGDKMDCPTFPVIPV